MPLGCQFIYILIAETVCIFLVTLVPLAVLHTRLQIASVSKVVWNNDLVHKTVENVFDEVCMTSRLLHAGHDCVLRQLDTCVRTIQVTKGAQEALTRQYREARWLGSIAKPSVDELLSQALVRMKGNPDQYHIFLSMLRAIEGLDLLVKAIEGDQGKT